MAQPNMHALSQHLIGIGNELALAPNFPLFNIAQHFNQINQQLQQLGAQMAANHAIVTGQLAQLTGQMAQLYVFSFYLVTTVFNSWSSVIAQSLLPMRLRNAASSMNAALSYPPGFMMVPEAPVYKRELLSLDGEFYRSVSLIYSDCFSVGNCQATAQALGLPAMLGHLNVVQMRQEIMDYLGAGLLAA